MKQIIVILILLTSLLSSFAYAEDAFPKGDFTAMRRIGQNEVKDIITPLTLLLADGSVVELSEIDIPDAITSNAADDTINPLAITARDILRDMLIGKRVTVYMTKASDIGRTNRMGHDLVQMERHDNEAWVQGTLLELGLARVKTSKANHDMAEQMLLIEAQARTDKRGIWADDVPYNIVTPSQAEDAIGTFAVVEGVIESVALNKNRVYVNFGKDWKNDFTVSIPPEDKRAFLNAQLDPMNWGKKHVRVRGYIRPYNGPYMEITHPEAIEFLKDPIHSAEEDSEITKDQE